MSLFGVSSLKCNKCNLFCDTI